MLRQDSIILTHEGRHERREQVHADLQAAAAEAVRHRRDAAADDVALGPEEVGRERIHEGEAGLGGVAADRQEGVAFGFPGGLDGLQVHAFGGIALHAGGAAAVEHAADAAHEGLRADAVEEDAVETAVGEEAVIDRHHGGRVLRVRRAVEAERLARGQVIIAGNPAPEVDRRRALAHLFGLGEHRQPAQHLDAFGVEVLPHFAVDVLVEAPADDDLADRDHVADRVDAADDLPGRVGGRMPGPEGHLDDIIGLSLPRLAGSQRQQAQDKRCNLFQGSTSSSCSPLLLLRAVRN